MACTRKPTDNTIHSQSETTVRNPSVGTGVNVELIRFMGCSFLIEATQNFFLGPCSLSAADNFSIALGGEKIVTEYIFLIVWVDTVVEWFRDFWIMR
jgi:hypothetical protein